MFLRTGRPSYSQGFARSAGESKYPNLWKGLVSAYVPLLGHTGNQLFDLSGFGRTGVFTGLDGTNWVISPDGIALLWDTVTEYVQSPETLTTTQDVTAFAYVKPNGLNYIISAFGDAWAGGNLDWVLWIDSVGGYRLHAYRYAGVDIITSNVLPSVVKYEAICGTIRDATNTGKIYVNGTEKGSNSTVSNYQVKTDYITLGNKPAGVTGNTFQGWMGCHYVWDRVLTDNEIRFLSSIPLAPFQLADRRFGFVAPVVGGFQPAWANQQNRLIGGGLSV